MMTAKLFVLLIFLLFPISFANLQWGYYRKSCRDVSKIIRQVVQYRYARDHSIAPALLRLHFHDCFVRGCDASLLVDPTPARPSEKNAGGNVGIRGFDVIDEIKSRLEQVCPQTVSCADILALAARDAVVVTGGPSYFLQVGRRDGLVSNPSEVDTPGPNIPIPPATEVFKSKGLSATDFVALMGGHTIGRTRCSFFQDRLSDGTMDPSLASRLRRVCSTPNNPLVFLDQGTPKKFDNEYYKQILMNHGILRVDHNLAYNKLTRKLVERFAGSEFLFRKKFVRAMIKMGRIGVLTGSDGEVRRNCRAFN